MMALNFPTQADLKLENAPLAEVVCQVRFPPILRISAEEPTAFQDLVRDSFPLVDLEHAFVLRLPGPGANETPSAEPKASIYRFHTPDKQTTISLAADFYALSTMAYTHWGEFARLLDMTHKAVEQVYRPAYATRIGLRYINRLTLRNTGAETVGDLLSILRPELTTHIHNQAWGEAIEMRCRLVLPDDQARLTMTTVLETQTDDSAFVLDLDYFEEGRLDLDHMIERCTHYNQAIYRAFRWALLDDRLEVFKPLSKDHSI
jgi:uncharacterized protein (TIGR04255 family)